VDAKIAINHGICVGAILAVPTALSEAGRPCPSEIDDILPTDGFGSRNDFNFADALEGSLSA